MSEVQELLDAANSLSTQLASCAAREEKQVKNGLNAGLEIVSMYIERLKKSMSDPDRVDLLKSVNAFTGVSKGLSDQGWLDFCPAAKAMAWTVTKLAISAAASIRA